MASTKKRSLEVEVLCSASKSIPPDLGNVRFDKFELTSVPTKKSSMSDTHERLLLKFLDRWKEGQMDSNPEKEGEYIFSILSLVLQMQVNLEATKISNLQTYPTNRISQAFKGKIEIPPDLEELFEKIYSIDDDTKRQFVRACSAHRTALQIIDENLTLSLFLLVTSVECLHHSNGFRKGFVDFIEEHLPDDSKIRIKNNDLFKRVLKGVYDIRSGFTHGGKELSMAMQMAYRTNRKYIRCRVRDEEFLVPNPVWLEQVVHTVLLEFLRKQKISEEKRSDLADLAREEARIHVKTKKPVRPGHIVFENDVDLD